MQTMRILLVVSIFAVAAATTYRDCGSREAQVKALQVSNCADGTPLCTFTRGTNASIGIQFTPQQNINQMNVRVYGIIGGIPVEFTMPQPNACLESGLKCPLASGQQVEYITYVPVLPIYPNIKAVVKFELVDAVTGMDAVCAMFPVQIVGGNGKREPTRALEAQKELSHLKADEKERTEKLDRLAQHLKPLLKRVASRSHTESDAGHIDAGSSFAGAFKQLLKDPATRERLSGPDFWDSLASMAVRLSKKNPNSQKLNSFLEAFRANQNQRHL